MGSAEVFVGLVGVASILFFFGMSMTTRTSNTVPRSPLSKAVGIACYVLAGASMFGAIVAIAAEAVM